MYSLVWYLHIIVCVLYTLLFYILHILVICAMYVLHFCIVCMAVQCNYYALLFCVAYVHMYIMVQYVNVLQLIYLQFYAPIFICKSSTDRSIHCVDIQLCTQTDCQIYNYNIMQLLFRDRYSRIPTYFILYLIDYVYYSMYSVHIIVTYAK